MTTPSMFVSRAGWGSTFNYRNNTAMPSSPRGTALHWEGPKMGTFPHSECDNKVRSIEKFHVETRGWAGIAYNALVCPHGYIFEGRGSELRSAANGDETVNNRYFAVCYLGGEGDPFTDPAKDAYIRAVQWLVADGNAGAQVVGHRDLTSTACPGSVIYKWLNETDFEDGGAVPPPPKPQVAVWDLPSTWAIGSTGEAVTKLGQRLVIWSKALGLPAPYQVGPGPEFTETDRKAVAAFQRAQGWTGADADGFPGFETFKRLSADPSAPPAPSHEEVTVLTLNVASRNAAVNKKYGSWTKRVPRIAKHILASGAEHIELQECYAEKRPALQKAIASKYWLTGVRGGRVQFKLIGSPGVPTGPAISADLKSGSGTKYAVGRQWKYESGALLNLSNAHLSFETTAAGAANRIKECNAWIDWQRKNFPQGYDFYVGDVNSPFKSTTRKDVVEPVFNAHGLHDVGRDVNAAAGPGRYHLDRGFGGKIRCKGIKVTSVDFTDHPSVKFTILVPTK